MTDQAKQAASVFQDSMAQAFNMLLQASTNESSGLVEGLKQQITVEIRKQFSVLENRIGTLEKRTLSTKTKNVGTGSGDNKKFVVPVDDPKNFSIEYHHGGQVHSAKVEGGKRDAGMIEGYRVLNDKTAEVILKLAPQQGTDVKSVSSGVGIDRELVELRADLKNVEKRTVELTNSISTVRNEQDMVRQKEVQEIRQQIAVIDERIMSAGRVFTKEKK